MSAHSVTDMRRHAVREYFARPPRWTPARVTLGAGIVSGAVSGALLAGDWAVAGGAALATAGGMAWSRCRRHRSDAALDRRRDGDLATIGFADALQAWGIERQDLVGMPSYVHVHAPLLDETAAQTWRTGSDGVVRFNPIRFVIVGFSSSDLLVHVGVLDMATGSVRGEQSARCAYQQLADVTTRIGSCRVLWEKESRQLDAEILVVDDGEIGSALRLPVRSPGWARLVGGALPSRATDRALSVIRSTVARRKRQLAGGTPTESSFQPEQ